tara:strand:- start:7513 stop:8811 length:1299 start_codon:yes stop_codon:yes gene_type:complete
MLSDLSLFKFESGFKYAHKTIFYDQSKIKIENLENKFLENSKNKFNSIGPIDFSKTIQSNFIINDSLSFHCIFFNYGTASYSSFFHKYCDNIKEKIIDIIKLNNNVIFYGHSQGAGTLITMMNLLCDKNPEIDFTKIYGITSGLGRCKSEEIDKFIINHTRYKFNYIDLINLSSKNISKLQITDSIINRPDNYPSPYGDYSLNSYKDKLKRISLSDILCIDKVFNNITILNDECDPSTYKPTEFPYFCRAIGKSNSGDPFMNPWYNDISDDYKLGLDPKHSFNNNFLYWIEKMKLNPYYSNKIDEIIKFNNICKKNIKDNESNWGDFNSFKSNSCMDLFKYFHKHITINTYGFVYTEESIKLIKINKEDILKKILDNPSDIGKLFEIRMKNELSPLTYIYNVTNQKIICQSSISEDGNAHKIKTYRQLFINN